MNVRPMKGNKVRIEFFKRINGKDIRASKVFHKDDKSAQHKWLAEMESVSAPTAKATVHLLVHRYINEVCSQKKSAKNESRNVLRWIREGGIFAQDRAISSITKHDINAWMQTRLTQVDQATVLREFNTIRDFFRQCGKTVVKRKTCWDILDANPCSQVIPPQGNPHKDRVISDEEIEQHYAACLTDDERRATDAWVFAIETGMRRQEVCAANASMLHGDHIKLFDAQVKTGKGRDVPLTMKALALFGKNGFGMSVYTLSRNFFRVAKRLGKDYTFHDARHTAATRLGHSGALSIFQLTEMFGWSSVEMARTYVKVDVRNTASILRQLEVQRNPLKVAA